MIADLPHALRDNPRFLARLDSRRRRHHRPGAGHPPTAAEFVLESIGEVQRFLDTLALPSGA